MRRSLLRVSAIVVLCALASACARGVVYTHITEPLVTNFQETPVGSRGESSDVRSFRYYVEVDWNENAIGQIAKDNGLEEVYYADLETLSVLGIWTQRWVNVVGK